MNQAGKEAIAVWRSLKSKQTFTTMNGLIAALDGHFAPKTNVHFARFEFSRCTQGEDETTDAFVTRLKSKAETCNFTVQHTCACDPPTTSTESYEEEALVNMVITKCNNAELRKKFLALDGKVTLDRVLAVARAEEASSRQARAMSEPKADQVNKLSRGKGFSDLGEKGNKGANAQKVFKCYACGQEGHRSGNRKVCPAYGQKCGYCKRIGHLEAVCFIKKRAEKAEKSVKYTTLKDEDSDSEESVTYQLKTLQVNKVSTSKERVYMNVRLNGKPVRMQLDSGADITIISEELANEIPGLKRQPCKHILRALDSDIRVLYTAKVKVQLKKEVKENLPLYVVNKPFDLFGLEWMDAFDPDWNKVIKDRPRKEGSSSMDMVRMSQLEPINMEPLEKLLERYKGVFTEGLGEVKNVTASLVLKPDVRPVFRAPRRVPIPIRPEVEKEIRRMEAEGNWVRVTHSEWGTPLVPVAKSTGGYRLCGDYKVTLNPLLQVAQHPLPNINDMLASLGNCRIFSKIDLATAFQQLVMDEQSQEYCTVSTHLGLFRPKRLPYGVASSPALWQQTMDKVFHALPGVCCFVDDILVAGRDEQEHRERLIQVLDRIKEHGIKVKRSKCCFNETTVEYLGFKLDARGVHKTDDKVRAMQEAAAPTDVKKLQSFLGLVTFYGKFVKDLATLAQPLYALLSKDMEWNWTRKCQQAFDAVKREVTSNSFLAHFNEHLPVKLVCDASSVGVGAVLAHVDEDGRERPIAYASRLLNAAEKGYSQIDKEALALVYGVKKFHMYLYGRRHFTLVTDHKPLLAILGSKSGLPKLVAARLHRWAITLAAYNYEVEYRSTKNMGNADALSRMPVDAAPDKEDIPQILLIETHGTPLTAAKVAQATSKDPVLAKVLQGVVAGRHTVAATVECQPYLDVWDELSVEKGCVLRGARVIIPHGLKDDVLEELHADHQGMVRTKALARTFVWWPNVDKDIEKKIRKCEGCALQQNNPKATYTYPWVYPETP